VRVYARRDVPEYRALGVKVALGDADHEGRLESALEQVHTLVHLTGGPGPERGTTVEWLNVETTEVALRAAVNAEVRRVLFLSPVGAGVHRGNPYLEAKSRAEEAVRSSGLEHAIFRCAPILGPGGALATLLRSGVPRKLRNVLANPVAVADVVDAVVAADARDAEVAGTWTLGGPEELTFGALADRLGARAGLPSRAPRAIAELYEHDAIADPAAAVAQFGLTLTPIDDAVLSGS
jgi:NADH dehydrogenase